MVKNCTRRNPTTGVKFQSHALQMSKLLHCIVGKQLHVKNMHTVQNLMLVQKLGQGQFHRPVSPHLPATCQATVYCCFVRVNFTGGSTSYCLTWMRLYHRSTFLLPPGPPSGSPFGSYNIRVATSFFSRFYYAKIYQTV